jgi:HEAT repeat protein
LERLERRESARKTARGGRPEDIIALLDSSERSVLLWAIGAVGDRRLTAAAPALVRHLESEDPELRKLTIGVLAQLELPETKDAFRKGLSDPSSEVRRLALRGLANIGDQSAVDVAEDSYDSGGAWMKVEALDALQRLPTQAALAALERLLTQERSFVWRHRIKKAIRRAERRAVDRTSHM